MTSLLACVLAAWAATAADTAGARQAIEATNKQFVAAVVKGDAAAVAGFYSSTAQVFPPNSDIVSGRAAIQKLWQGVIDSGVKGATLQTLDVESAGDLASESGRYTMTGANGKVLDRGKYSVVWKREGGQWKLHRDIWNTSMPAPEPPKAPTAPRPPAAKK